MLIEQSSDEFGELVLLGSSVAFTQVPKLSIRPPFAAGQRKTAVSSRIARVGARHGPRFKKGCGYLARLWI
jgi:hypothetical protein